ncbi:hypothetical protein P3574_24575, partial [Vibrio parahaemolyticus]|nr:hypothetical protein [Vibrio parahaemolyticus]
EIFNPSNPGPFVILEHCLNVPFGCPEHHTLRVAERTLDTLSVETEQQSAERSECVINLTVGSFM